MIRGLFTWIVLCVVGGLLSCSKPKPYQFEVLDASKTSLQFVNGLKPTPRVNMLTYMYFYNGAGVGAGDLNNDGRIDLFFASNQGRNSLFLNTGDVTFRDVTDQSGIPDDGGWSTGVSIVDINQDGLLDIYVCRVGQYEDLKQGNLLLLCERIDAEGIPHYVERSAEYGISFHGFSTQAAFFDQDLDGDLDMYLLNHSLRYNSTFNARPSYFNTYDSLSGDRFFRNVNGKFLDETKQSGINSSVIGYGLGVVVSDINLDGYPDLYIGNDFHENDYLYINNRKGGFIETLNSAMQHTSQFSMGVDAADINNDALPDIISMDMLPEDPYILKRSLGEDEYNLFNMKLRYGYNHQYARNNLQLNRGQGVFSEVGTYAGVHATDWSWAPLWFDFDNDGLKDLFVSNGIPRRLNDIDYVNFISNDDIQSKIRSGQMTEKEMKIIDQFPQIKLKNKMYRNAGEVKFEDLADQIKGDKISFSNGAVYADLDNDGDLDVVVNNIDETPLVYKNNSNTLSPNSSIRFELSGSKDNVHAIGAKLLIYGAHGISTYEKFPVKGFQSSMEIPLLTSSFSDKIDSVLVIWPDNRYQKITSLGGKQLIKLSYQNDLPFFNYDVFRNKIDPDTEVWSETYTALEHKENAFNEFDREPLLPHMVSTEGPAFAISQLKTDSGYLFFGSSKGMKSRLMRLNKNAIGSEISSVDLCNDSTYEDVDAVFADANGDGAEDLIVVSAGNEYYGETPYLTPRLYLNLNGVFQRKGNAFPAIYNTLSCVRVYDIDSDGDLDVFLGGRAQPFAYGMKVSSYILLNDGKGSFIDQTNQIAPALIDMGMVTDAQWADINGDGKKDLVVAKDWGAIEILYAKQKNTFDSPIAISEYGWWNTLLVEDLDRDGDMDIVAGNQGLNTRLKPESGEPVRMYYQDFDGNGIGEQVVTYSVGGKEICFAVKSDLERQMPGLKKKFLYAEDFAKSDLNQIFTKEKLRSAVNWYANDMRSVVLMNQGGKKFSSIALPWKAQLSPIRSFQVVDANGDQLPDILALGNYYENNVQLGRADADFGSLLINKGQGQFVIESLGKLRVEGQIRKLVNWSPNRMFAVRNNGKLSIISK